MKMQQVLAFVLPVIFALPAFLSAAEKFTIGVSIPAATHGWTGGVVWCAEQAKAKIEKENPGVNIVLATSPDTGDQANKIENLIARDVDALVIMSQEPGPLFRICKRAKKKGIYLVIVSNPLSQPIQDVFVNGDNRSFGTAAAEAMGKVLGGKGNIVMMEGIPCPINTDRTESFRKALAEKYPEIKIMESRPADWNTEKGLAVMENFLQKYKNIDGVWAGDDDVLTGVLKACQESKRSDVKAMIGGGGSKKIVRMVMEDNTVVKGTVTYPPQMITTGIEAALKGLRNGKKTDKKDAEIIVPSQVVTKENAKEHYFPDSIY